MYYVKQIERLQLLNKLIIQERTGSPEELSCRLGVSKRQLFNLMDSMKNLGVELSYNKRIKTYYYAGNSKIEIQFSLVRLDGEEQERIYGGNVNNYQERNPISLSEDTLDIRYNRYI